MTDKLTAERSGHIARITVNNPERRNAMSLDMWQAMGEALERFASDDEVRVVILCGAGDKAFVSGADISKFESERSSADAIGRYDAVTGLTCSLLGEFPKPTIAEIGGFCVGGGLNLAACCDLRIAADHSRFAMPAAKLGLGYSYASLKRLAQVMGLPNALEFAYTARLFSADETFAMGFVNRVVPAAELAGYVADYAATIAANAPMTIAAFKAAAVELGRHESERDLDRVQAMVERCFASEDYTEGRRAFMEKRAPAFRGR